MADKTESSDKPEDKRTLKGVLKQLAEDSSLHGVPKIVSSRQIPVKILWCMLFLTTFIVLMIQIHSLFVTFHAYPIQTSVSLEFSPLSFPAITVCNMNPVRRSEVNMSQPIKDIIYPKVKKKKTGEDTSRKKRETHDDIHKLQQQKEPIRQQGQTRKRVREDNHDEIQSHANVMLQSQGDVQSRTKNMDYEGIEDLLVHFHQEELLERIRRDASSPVMASSTVAVASSSSIEPTASNTVAPTVSSGQTAGSQPVSSSVVASDSYSTGSSSYYYEYDYWGNFWDYTSYSTSDYSSDSYYQEWAEWYSRYYSSGSNFDYYDGTSYSTGYETFLFDQYFSQKDKWDERIINFQTVFKNESTLVKTSKLYQDSAEWYSRYYSSGSNSDYYDGTSYSTGYETFLFDQYFSQKDKWDERIINFQTVFKNESTCTKTSKVYQDWAEWYSRYYSSGSNYDYYDGTSYSTGYETFLFDQYFSQKDKWDERIINFQTVFKNESTCTKTPKVYSYWAEWYSRYYSSSSNFDYYDGTSYSTGYETFLFDQYFSQKDKWDERIINFQTVFKNESTLVKTSKVHQDCAERYSRYYSSGSNYDYYDGTSYSTGYETFLFDQYFSQKDKWDERIINFQTVFKNESTSAKTSKVYQEWAELYSRYYSSGSNYDYYDGTSYSTGYETFLFDQYFSQKDKWDERIINFQTVFKNESTCTKTSKVYSYWAEWYSRYYSSDSNFDYYDGTSYGTGYETFLFDQYFSQKDKWDERIINFQTVFKNESTSLITSIISRLAEWYSRYYRSGSNFDYYDGTSYSTGYETFLFDQYFSQKDKWDERIINFQTVFKNESTTTRQKMGHKKEDVIVGATFVRSVQNITNFHEFTTPEYGNCYTMTSPKYKAWRSGPAHGIKLTLNLEVNEYIENFATGYGIRIVFHAPGTYPLASEEGLTLSPGYETSVGLRMVQITRLGDPYGECSDGSKFFKQYGIRYSTAACMQFCRVRKAIEVCKCIPHDAPDIDFYTGVQVCKNSGSDKLCTIQVDVKFDDGSYQAECDCKSPCHEIVYEKTMSGRRWPNDDYLKNVLLSNACSMNISSLTVACGHLQNNTFDFEMSEKYRNNFLQVLIYFEDLNYESISQEPLYESVRFLSDIGGAMGLFLGASMLSFVEFLQLGLELGLYAWKKFMGCQQISPNQSENYATSDKSGMKTPVSLIDPDLNMDKEMKI